MGRSGGIRTSPESAVITASTAHQLSVDTMKQHKSAYFNYPAMFPGGGASWMPPDANKILSHHKDATRKAFRGHHCSICIRKHPHYFFEVCDNTGTIVIETKKVFCEYGPKFYFVFMVL